jgi:hypothetical protein
MYTYCCKSLNKMQINIKFTFYLLINIILCSLNKDFMWGILVKI